MFIRDAKPSDFPEILRLNEESVHFLSPLTAAKLEVLHQQAAYHRVLEQDGKVLAFLLVFRDGSRYESKNYLWFCEHYEHFLYIDRIVVSLNRQGKKLGNRLYQDLFLFAKNNHYPRITCEFDIDPPNEASKRFHEHFGFQEVGRQHVSYANKQVSMQSVVL